MIGILFFGTIFGYILLSKFIINKVYERYGTKKARNIALTIMILIPTWDIVLGYPIYKFLCWKDAGVHIYKTLDNVEGFYVGVREKTPILLPYKGYKYIDYRERRSGKYYRNSWINNNTSKDCVSYIGAWNYDYTQAFRHGKCIVKKEIPEKEVSQWEYNWEKNTRKLYIPIVKIYKSTVPIIDRQTDKNIAENIGYSLDNNWFLGFVQSSISSRGVWASCSGDKDMLRMTLKPKKGEK